MIFLPDLTDLWVFPRTATNSDWLSISSTENGRTWLSQQLSTSMNLSFSRESLSAVWNYFDEEGHCYSWLLRFDELEKYSEFMEGVTRLMWEGMNEEKWVEGKNAKVSFLEFEPRRFCLLTCFSFSNN